MDNKTYGIGILTLTAVALLLANVFSPRTVSGMESVANDEMQAVTAKARTGGDALYLLDNSTGKLAVFTVTSKNGLKLQTVVNLDQAFREAGSMQPVGAAGGARK